MKVSDLILELQEFHQVYGDLEVAACPPVFSQGRGLLEKEPAAVVGLERIGKPGKAMRCYLRVE